MTDLKLTVGTWQTHPKALEVRHVEPADVVRIELRSDPAGTSIDKIEWTKDGKPWDPAQTPDVEVTDDLANGEYRLEFTAIDKFLGDYRATGELGPKRHLGPKTHLTCSVTLARATQAGLKQKALAALGAAVTAVHAASGSKNPRADALALGLQDILTRSHVAISDTDA